MNWSANKISKVKDNTMISTFYKLATIGAIAGMALSGQNSGPDRISNQLNRQHRGAGGHSAQQPRSSFPFRDGADFGAFSIWRFGTIQFRVFWRRVVQFQ